ncbi:MAG: hypothetical protein HWN67_10640 [Candidatus Helarchaeota archaeon]|nr:hypothetical protein [Candidatus Helarchaeota archaeon]
MEKKDLKDEDIEEDSSSSIVTELAEASQLKKKRKLKAYYCPFCNHPSSKLTENQLNLLDMGMVVECKKCGDSIKKNHLEI